MRAFDDTPLELGLPRESALAFYCWILKSITDSLPKRVCVGSWCALLYKLAVRLAWFVRLG